MRGQTRAVPQCRAHVETGVGSGRLRGRAERDRGDECARGGEQK